MRHNGRLGQVSATDSNLSMGTIATTSKAGLQPRCAQIRADNTSTKPLTAVNAFCLRRGSCLLILALLSDTEALQPLHSIARCSSSRRQSGQTAAWIPRIKRICLISVAVLGQRFVNWTLGVLLLKTLGGSKSASCAIVKWSHRRRSAKGTAP